MNPRPRTADQWVAYVRTLTGVRLYEVTVAANSQTFTRALLDEGADMFDVELIMGLLASRLQEEGMLIPEGGPWDLRSLLISSPTLLGGNKGLGGNLGEEIVEVGDDLDDFEMVAELSAE